MSPDHSPRAPSLDSVRHPVFVMDPIRNRVVEANQAGCEMLGYERDELLATPISEVHPAEMPQLSAWVTQVRNDRHGWTALFVCRTKSGTYLPVEMTALAPDPDGLVVVFERDRSAHRGPAA